MDGEWEPPMIDNPEYKGEWKPRQIDNPDYKGPWVHPEIDNPEYNPDDAKDIGKYAENCKIGFDLWQVKSGTIFDNMMITDDPAEAKAAGEALWAVTKEARKKMTRMQRTTMSCEVVWPFVFIKHVLVLCGALCKSVLDPSNRILGSPLCAPRTLPSEFHSETSSINNPNVLLFYFV